MAPPTVLDVLPVKVLLRTSRVVLAVPRAKLIAPPQPLPLLILPEKVQPSMVVGRFVQIAPPPPKALVPQLLLLKVVRWMVMLPPGRLLGSESMAAPSPPTVLEV